MTVFRYQPGIAIPNQLTIEAFQRVGAISTGSFVLQFDSVNVVNQNIVGCITAPSLTIEANYFSSNVVLPSTTYNHPGGYLFTWSSCCRNGGIVNIQNPSSSSHQSITLFPPVSDLNGNPIVNTSPSLYNPINDYAVSQIPFSNNFGGYDPDGDSLVFELYTPFEQGAPVAGNTSNPIFAPYPDPATQVANVFWALGYNVDDQIHGFPGPNPSPNRLKIDANTGEVSFTANTSSSGYYATGITCKEYRNGSLIGAIYRDITIGVFNPSALPPNSPPNLLTPQNQSLATWLGDTLVFSGSPVCVQIDVTDPDTVADIRLEIVQTDYPISDVSFVQSSAVISNNDTFNTALCFQPDSFLSTSSEVKILAFDNLCHNIKSDTLSFWFKFINYSNAGWGGVQHIPISPSSSTIDLITLMQNNPNPGGSWIDLDSSGLMSASGIFAAQNVTTNSTFRFLYIDQQLNYPADTGYLELRFFNPLSLKNGIDATINVYPNPANDAITFDFNENNQFTKLSLFDLNGKIVYEQAVTSNYFTISTSDFAEGLYYFRLLSSTGLKSGKVLIQH